MKQNSFYKSWEVASKSAKRLRARNQKEYKSLYKKDPRLPSNPNRAYKDVWKERGGWNGFLGRDYKVYYVSWYDASKAARKLKIKTIDEYRKRYKEDPKLPASPDLIYKEEWHKKGKYYGFLGKKKKAYYECWDDASLAAKKLCISSSSDYSRRYKKDPLLPGNPVYVYRSVWDVRGKWNGFLGKENKRFYDTYSEASNAAKKLGIKNKKEYLLRYKEDPHLPSEPNEVYKGKWNDNGGYAGFLGQKKKVDLYKTWEEASEAARALKIKGQLDYVKRHHLDPRLPRNPYVYFGAVWMERGGLREFLGKAKKDNYKEYCDACDAAQKLGIRTQSEYKARYKEDPLLPFDPEKVYKNDWLCNHGWFGFLGSNFSGVYPTWDLASAAAQRIKCVSPTDYASKREEDAHLPAIPYNVYESEWEKRGGWIGFLSPTECKSLSDVKQLCKIIGIKNSKEYKDKRKEFSALPSHPERKYKSEWVSWYDLLDIPTPYSYEETRKIIRDEGIYRQVDYKNFVKSSDDPRLPRSPEETYANEWINWYIFFGKEAPYRTKYIEGEYEEWREKYINFMKIARGGTSKESILCKFLREYIQKYELGTSPSSYLTENNDKIIEFRQFLSEQGEKEKQAVVLNAINEFLDFVLRTELTIEDEDTGELVTVLDAKNVLSNVSVSRSGMSTRVNETAKPALAYQYVEAVRFWIAPADAKTFSDLTNIQNFDADWVEVNEAVIDESDPDCVFKYISGKPYLWLPIYWMHTYSLVSVPARGFQIAYNDSGEADEYIPDIVNGELLWIKNNSALAGMTDRQGFIKQYQDNQIGMHFTSNKTSSLGAGYDVPWMPIELAYWLIRLRKWQEKYNPIDKPTAWLDCSGTNMNESQLKARGVNCFLFRDYKKEEAGRFQARLANRLAASLYHSQPDELTLAQLTGSENHLSHYFSRYTPHSMRVSLIGAYVMEFGLPIEVIMKVVGHSSILMTIYYLKMSGEDLRNRFEEGEKQALKRKAYAAQRMIEQNRIEELKQEFVGNSSEALRIISNETPTGNFLFRDYGICPTAGSSCGDGGEEIGKSRVRGPTPNGYLGSQNCVRCRHFVTGPAFLGGLLSLFNEISLSANQQSEQYNALNYEIEKLNKASDEFDENEYDAIRRGERIEQDERYIIDLRKRKLNSESESAAKKMDMLLCDMQACTRLINQCAAIVNDMSEEHPEEAKLQLMVDKEHSLHVAVNETSYFRQLCEVCENAIIYESASAKQAISPRAQILDRVSAGNNLPYRLFELTDKQQLFVGNQMVSLLLKRLKTWQNVDALVNGNLTLMDLPEEERLVKRDFDEIFNGLLLDNKDG